MEETKSMWALGLEIVNSLEMGEKKELKLPVEADLAKLRHSLTMNGKMKQKAFKTKKNGNKLIIMRVEPVEI